MNPQAPAPADPLAELKAGAARVDAALAGAIAGLERAQSYLAGVAADLRLARQGYSIFVDAIVAGIVTKPGSHRKES